jgi:tetratricopeptide (TPR) repeat protein
VSLALPSCFFVFFVAKIIRRSAIPSAMFRRIALLFAIVVAAEGCGQIQTPKQAAAPAPPIDPKAQLTLEQVPPPTSEIPPPLATTQPDAPAPVESLALFAAARDAMIDSNPAGAITWLNKAIQIDPDSYHLYRALGEAYLAISRRPSPEELKAFENALALKPDDLHLQAVVGTQYATLGETDKALAHLRLAVLSTDYPNDDVTATEVDWVLAPLLDRMGYDRAALDEYTALMNRLQNPSFDMTSDPGLAELLAAPQQIWLEAGRLDEKLGRWSAALDAYRAVAATDTSDFALQDRIVRMMANMGQNDAALIQAADAVLRFGANSDSVRLLEDVARQNGRNPADVLREMCQAHPDDQGLVLCLAGVLIDEDRKPEAQDVLESAVSKFGLQDRPVVDKLFDLYLDRDEIPAGARLLVEFLAAEPDAVGEIEPMWASLLQTSRPNSLQLPVLEQMQVEATAEPARQYLIWRLADLWRRDVMARDALQAAVKSNPPFAPAFRQLVLADWARPDWDQARKQRETEALAVRAESIGNPGLAAELRGISALSRSDTGAGIDEFEKALALGDSSPPLLLTYADTLQVTGQAAKAEPLYRQLVQQHPKYSQAWQALFQFYLRQRNVDAARKTVGDWITADPASVPGRVLEADLVAEGGDVAAAESAMLKLFADHEDDPDVISALINLGRRTGHVDEFLAKLDDLRRREPANETAVEWLVNAYTDEGRAGDAVRVLDEDRAAVANDPDLLYQIAHLYEQVGQAQTTEAVLAQVVSLDPTNSSACNDLGYTWADQGKNLPRAESLIRIAVAQEPDNQSFLDSLGWVLYKQARYAEAEGYFEKAVGPSSSPDPVVLSHFGDVLYRLGKKEQAADEWRRSLAGLDQADENRSDLRGLRALLSRKVEQVEQGLAASVAPLPK